MSKSDKEARALHALSLIGAMLALCALLALPAGLAVSCAFAVPAMVIMVGLVAYLHLGEKRHAVRFYPMAELGPYVAGLKKEAVRLYGPAVAEPPGGQSEILGSLGPCTLEVISYSTHKWTGEKIGGQRPSPAFFGCVGWRVQGGEMPSGADAFDVLEHIVAEALGSDPNYPAALLSYLSWYRTDEKNGRSLALSVEVGQDDRVCKVGKVTRSFYVIIQGAHGADLRTGYDGPSMQPQKLFAV